MLMASLVIYDSELESVSHLKRRTILVNRKRNAAMLTRRVTVLGFRPHLFSETERNASITQADLLYSVMQARPVCQLRCEHQSS